MKKKVIKAIIGAILITGIGFGGYYGYRAFFGTKAVAATNQYYSTKVKKMNLEVTVQGMGAAYASVTKDVKTNNAGTIKNLNVKVGDTVKSRQTLFTADSDDLRNAVTTAKDNLKKQNLTLSSDENAEKVDDNKIAMDKISVSEANDSLTKANTALNKMTVTAPIGGIITAVNNSNGDDVQSGTSILTIVDTSSMKVKISVDELDIGKIEAGQKATIKFDAIKDKTYDGTVESIAQVGTTSNNVTTYDVIVNVSDPSGIRLGMNANVSISVESKENALAVPAEAVIENNGEKFVRVSTSDSSTDQSNMKLVSVKTGLETEKYIEITEGVTEDQLVYIQLPKSSSSSTNSYNGMGGFGNFTGGQRSQRSQGSSGAQGTSATQGTQGSSATQGTNSSQGTQGAGSGSAKN
ncbi:MAG: efflux RND transporter periplasmic adaptor subunit [Clostridiaceae bacterium]